MIHVRRDNKQATASCCKPACIGIRTAMTYQAGAASQRVTLLEVVHKISLLGAALSSLHIDLVSDQKPETQRTETIQAETTVACPTGMTNPYPAVQSIQSCFQNVSIASFTYSFHRDMAHQSNAGHVQLHIQELPPGIPGEGRPGRSRIGAEARYPGWAACA